MDRLLTTNEVAEYFKVKPRTITQKFIGQGLKVIPIGKKDYRYDKKDVEEFAETLKSIAEIQQEPAIRRKPKYKTTTIDYEKRRINLIYNKVV